MKRLALLTATSQAVLWIRQLRYERRLSNRQGRWEREADRALKRHGEDVSKGFAQVGSILNRWGKEVSSALARSSGGQRR